jgi:beta-lactamase class A
MHRTSIHFRAILLIALSILMIGNIVVSLMICTDWPLHLTRQNSTVLLSDAPSTSQFGKDITSIQDQPTIDDFVGKTVLTSSEATEVYSTPNSTTQSIATFYTSFEVTFTGEKASEGNETWCSIRWQSGKNQQNGWILCQNLNISSNAQLSATEADLGALSIDIQSYAQDWGNDLSVAVYIPSNNSLYTYNPSVATTMASTAKVPILLTLIHMAENQHRQLTAKEISLATNMIEVSDNDAAQAIYDEVGGMRAVNQYLQSIGITGITMNELFGYSTATSAAMIKLLNAIDQGSILSSSNRDFFLNLMEHIESDQQYGVGNSAPDGAVVAMKAGWVTGPDGLWATSSVGIVMSGQTKYIVAVYTHDRSGLNSGFSIMDKICGDIADILI